MSKLRRLLSRRKETKRLSAVMGVHQDDGERTAGTRKNSQTAEGLQQLHPEIWGGIDQRPFSAVPSEALGHERALEAMIAGVTRIAGPIPINDPLPVATNRYYTDPKEVHDRLRQARFERGHIYASGAAGAMGIKLSSYRAHENESRDLAIKSATRYAAFFAINSEGLMTGKCENDGKADTTSFEFPLGDDDFELVLRHFWKHLDAEKRRKLIQMAAGLVDGGAGSYDWIEKEERS
jgi:hypothetical protein